MAEDKDIQELSEMESEEQSQESSPVVPPQSGTIEAVKASDEIDYRKDPTSNGGYNHRYGQEPFMGRVQPHYDQDTQKPASPTTQRTAEEISEAHIKKFFGSWTNESGLTVDDWIYMTVFIREKGNTQHTSQFCIKDKLAELLNGAYSAIRFKNDARAKSVIALIKDATEMGSAKNITWHQKYKAIEAILKEHPAIDPREHKGE